jgi:broad specificity phosphatase PhoE
VELPQITPRKGGAAGYGGRVSDLQCPARVYLARHAEAGAPLTEPGERQARALGEGLRAARIARVYTSPLPRAARTAGLAAEVLAVAVEVLPALVEVGEVPGEGAADVVTRMTGALEDIADRHRGEAVLVVGHLAAIGLTLPHLIDGPAAAPLDPGLDPGAWLALEGDADGWTLRRRDGEP